MTPCSPRPETKASLAQAHVEPRQTRVVLCFEERSNLESPVNTCSRCRCLQSIHDDLSRSKRRVTVVNYLRLYLPNQGLKGVQIVTSHHLRLKPKHRIHERLLIMGFVNFDVDQILPDEDNLQCLGFWGSVVRGNHLDGNILRVFSSAPFLRDVYR